MEFDITGLDDERAENGEVSTQLIVSGALIVDGEHDAMVHFDQRLFQLFSVLVIGICATGDVGTSCAVVPDAALFTAIGLVDAIGADAANAACARWAGERTAVGAFEEGTVLCGAFVTSQIFATTWQAAWFS